MGAMAAGAFLDKSNPPDAEAFLTVVGGARDRWIRLDDWARQTYGVGGESNFFGPTTGWTLRYRRAGKALFTLTPRIDGFSAIVVVGPTAWPRTAELRLAAATRAALEATQPYPEGRWAWFDVADEDAVSDVITLVTLKAPPPRRRPVANG
jgi:hypothetical protein